MLTKTRQLEKTVGSITMNGYIAESTVDLAGTSYKEETRPFETILKEVGFCDPRHRKLALDY